MLHLPLTEPSSPSMLTWGPAHSFLWDLLVSKSQAFLVQVGRQWVPQEHWCGEGEGDSGQLARSWGLFSPASWAPARTSEATGAYNITPAQRGCAGLLCLPLQACFQTRSTLLCAPGGCNSWAPLGAGRRLEDQRRKRGCLPPCSSLPSLSLAVVSRFFHQKPQLPFGGPFL